MNNFVFNNRTRCVGDNFNKLIIGLRRMWMNVHGKYAIAEHARAKKK
jgi:hypothetical protein